MTIREILSAELYLELLDGLVGVVQPVQQQSQRGLGQYVQAEATAVIVEGPYQCIDVVSLFGGQIMGLRHILSPSSRVSG